ncbi:import inner membrane translocase subunit Tim44 [Oleidesulfovibrio alaskensis G20]|uniref:Import inner membrane translocase subunit Tim44 n=1 Tax=Oleidesulfovibrio alaskensis (strain ATCC BAA-1058 / DSM 17464 / G20) TaxID=207559 RepID=Q314S2_OLEA2|nr:Tim44-like domain-containing protein [Oleidesulfovibrio alaskensis]ABB37574.1 import inner membrane translocase subunit Tim44 [Oleidesulfovibrio alaskensis G20]MBG0773140.1 Tim44 domain-containing protein [Oleidesulfovibrio alaskensis]MBL3581350.1 Tim44 domain-containing protein [Oleidesulfovibrio alaskensis]
MTRRIMALLLPVLAAGLLLSAVDDAWAKRMGGGKSFGSRPSFTKSYSKPDAPTKSPAMGSSAATAPKRGFGGLGGMFGGLLAGTLLGSMLFGGGFGGIGFFDILLFGGVIFLILRMMRRRGAPRGEPAYQAGGAYQGGASHDVRQHDNTMYRQAQDGWSGLRSAGSGSPSSAAPAPEVPAGFDTEEFLQGARSVYTRLQNSWDNRDLDDIRTFTSPSVFDEIHRQAQDDPQPSRTELLLINARVLEVKEETDGMLATVYFDVLMREDASGGNPEQVREVWHFHRATPDAMWRLDGIQQLEQ